MKTYLLPESLRNDLIAYLHARPYSEVAKGVQALEALQPAPEPVPAQSSTEAKKE